MRMDLSIVIVNYNVKHYLEQCLDSVFRSERPFDVEVFVVDNVSSDGSIPYLKERYPQVRFIQNTENVGFARANNQAIRQSTGRYVLLLNPDTIVGEHTLAESVRLMDSHPDAGGSGTRMLRTDGSFALESRRGLPTPFVAFCKMSGLTKLFPRSRTFGRYYMRYLDENVENEIEIISGAYMMLRREALDKVGLLDEAFFMYGEDIDLSYRLLKAGYKNYYSPSPILHYKGESTVKSSFRYVYTFYHAMQLFFNKHFRRYGLLVSLPISAAIWVRSAFAYLGNQFRREARSEGEAPVYRPLFVGSEEMLRKACAIYQKRYPSFAVSCIQGTETTLPEGHLSRPDLWETFDMVVYDTDNYSYGTILRNLAATASHNLRLGTWSARTGMFINENIVL